MPARCRRYEERGRHAGLNPTAKPESCGEFAGGRFFGELHVTERGRVVAKLVPAAPPPAEPFFARRKLTRAYRAAGRFLTGGTDATAAISAERDHAVP